jgi:hypothetical protein
VRFQKPEPWGRVKARRDRQYDKARHACRSAVFARVEQEHGDTVCERCGRWVSDDVPEWADNRAHVHESRPRSSGGDPLNPAECVLWCRLCHLGTNGTHRVERAGLGTG